MTLSEVKAKRLPELDDEFASESAGFDTLAELREDIVSRLKEADEARIDREFEQAVLDAAVAESQIELPEKLVHARAHELLEETLSSLARQGISKETYLRITGKDEEAIAHEAEPEAGTALRREAVLAAIVEAEQIEPSDEAIREALEPIAQRTSTKVEKLLERLRSDGRLDRIRQDVATRQALDLLVARSEADQRRAGEGAREAVDAGQGGRADQPGRLWTPGA